MRKRVLFISLFLVAMFSFNLKLNASCLNSELNEWALDTNVKFVNFDRYLVVMHFDELKMCYNIDR